MRFTDEPEGDEWRYDLKHDGYRAFDIRQSRIALSALPNETVEDGEIVAFDESGKPSFNTASEPRVIRCPPAFASTSQLGRLLVALPLAERPETRKPPWLPTPRKTCLLPSTLSEGLVWPIRKLQLTIGRTHVKLDKVDRISRAPINLFPDLYLPIDECGDYLHPGFLMRLDADSVHTIFEVGCSDGIDTLRLADRFPAVVHAFECNPEILVKTRLTVNNHDRIRLIERAVWDSECALPFFPVVAATHLGTPGQNPGASSCFRARSDYLQRYEQIATTVPAIRLDSYCKQHGVDAIDLLCIDAQGAELRALQGLGDSIGSVRYVIIEIEVRPIYEDQALYPEIHAYLTSRGFKQAAEVYRDDWFSDYLYVRPALSL